MRLSIVILAHNEAASLPKLIAEIGAAFPDRPLVEIVVVDDGSDDGTGDCLAGLIVREPRLKPHRLANRSGQSRALIAGVEQASGDWIAMLDGDGQNDPADLTRLLARTARDPLLSAVAGLRRRREDRWSKRLASRLANMLRRALLRDGCRDGGCGLKLVRREVFLALPRFDGMHRFIPALIQIAGGQIAYVEVTDRPRRHGRSHYGNWDRAWRAGRDLIYVWRLRRRAVRRAREKKRDSA